MKSDHYLFPRVHFAEMNGGEVAFRSVFREGTHGLWSDALQACKNAGLFREPDDGRRMKVR
ncbi:MAG: hypothetical protein IJ087_01285 [Eggerthellaceae bacterium]|nr:hypothetical protein [Eggerthellaceae bacterium]